MRTHGDRLQIKMIETQNDVTIIELLGDLDLGTLQEAKNCIDENLKKGSRRFLIDLGLVAYIDSSGLGFLMGSLKKVREEKGELKIAKLNAYLMGIFKLLNLHEVLEVYEDTESALRAFSA